MCYIQFHNIMANNFFPACKWTTNICAGKGKSAPAEKKKKKSETLIKISVSSANNMEKKTTRKHTHRIFKLISPIIMPVQCEPHGRCPHNRFELPNKKRIGEFFFSMCALFFLVGHNFRTYSLRIFQTTSICHWQTTKPTPHRCTHRVSPSRSRHTTVRSWCTIKCTHVPTPIGSI